MNLGRVAKPAPTIFGGVENRHRPFWRRGGRGGGAGCETRPYHFWRRGKPTPAILAAWWARWWGGLRNPPRLFFLGWADFFADSPSRPHVRTAPAGWQAMGAERNTEKSSSFYREITRKADICLAVKVHASLEDGRLPGEKIWGLKHRGAAASRLSCFWGGSILLHECYRESTRHAEICLYGVGV